MLVSQKHKLLVFHHKDQVEIASHILTAKPLEIAGTPVLAVPHRLEETQMLRNMGLQVPSPIGYHYHWPGRFTPYLHQREQAGFLTLHRRAFCLSEIGVGKTLSALWAADYAMSEGLLQRALILAPLSTLERVWADEIFINLPHRNFVVLHGTAAKRKKLLARPHDFYIINHDGFEIIADELQKRKDIQLIILDECGVYRNGQTGRFKALRGSIKPHHWVWAMTGTPTPNAPSDAWAQCRLVVPERVPPYFTAFRNLVMSQISQYIWEPRKGCLNIVYNALQPSIRYTRDQCLDLPGEVHSTRSVELSAQQKHHYKEIMEKLITEIEGGVVKAVNEGVKLMKLVQAACGVVYGVDGRALKLDCKERIQLVCELIEEAGEKVIVFAPFTSVVRMLEREISKHWSCAVVIGDVSKNQRDRIFADFQQAPKPHVLVADPGCMSHGLTLTEASTIIWYAPITSNDEYTQANGRITRAGQKYVANIINITATELERRMFKRLKNRQKLQGLLLDMVELHRHTSKAVDSVTA